MEQSETLEDNATMSALLKMTVLIEYLNLLQKQPQFCNFYQGNSHFVSMVATPLFIIIMEQPAGED